MPIEKSTFDVLMEAYTQAAKRCFEGSPPHLVRLGKLLRRSVEKDTTVKLRRFLTEQNIHVKRKDLPIFRDLLIVGRVDLKDLEPEARKRLRARTLLGEDPEMMTADYKDAMSSDDLPTCRDCEWFVKAPDGEEKSCVEFGTKGADMACFGFVRTATS